MWERIRANLISAEFAEDLGLGLDWMSDSTGAWYNLNGKGRRLALIHFDAIRGQKVAALRWCDCAFSQKPCDHFAAERRVGWFRDREVVRERSACASGMGTYRRPILLDSGR
jgi:hypothetical protein